MTERKARARAEAKAEAKAKAKAKAECRGLSTALRSGRDDEILEAS